MSTYSKKLKSPHWQKMRLKVMQRDKFTCKLCNDTETTLNVHHKYYEDGREPWEYPMNALITLCEHCHFEVTRLTKETNYPYEAFRIFKSANWANESRIMFIYFDLMVNMRIYNREDEFLIGYLIEPRKCAAIIKLLKNATKYV